MGCGGRWRERGGGGVTEGEGREQVSWDAEEGRRIGNGWVLDTEEEKEDGPTVEKRGKRDGREDGRTGEGWAADT
jgi:hypothetical protein